MIELELILNQLEKMYEKEKGLRNRVLLEKSIESLKEYESSTSVSETSYFAKK